jgi:oligopeptide/dipeptide ABC transporter ATP-binding protein
VGDALIRIDRLKKYYSVRERSIFGQKNQSLKAVDDVTFSINSGEVLAIVGESGCGKSTLGRLVVRLIEPDAGTIIFDGRDITNLKGDALREIRRQMQIVFQDPFGSLNPRLTVGDAIAYPLKVHGRKEGLQQKVQELLDRVGLNALHGRRLPHELSGGQRQRIGIARAIALNPRLLVLDEPVASLDVSAQAHILNLFKELQREMEISYIFITHDLSVAQYMADRILVMYSGKIMEIGECNQLLEEPAHPYTEALLSAAVLGAWKDKVKETILEGDPPSPIEPPVGCRFSTRCPYAELVCKAEEPTLSRLETGHLAACHWYTGVLERRKSRPE